MVRVIPRIPSEQHVHGVNKLRERATAAANTAVRRARSTVCVCQAASLT